MADNYLELQLQRLSEILETSGCKESVQMQIENLVKEMLLHADPVAFYQGLFAGEYQGRDTQAQRIADMLQLSPNGTGRILYLQISEAKLHDSAKELLCSVLESKEGKNTCVPMEKGIFAIVYDISQEDDAKEFSFAMAQSIQEELACEAAVGMGNIFTNLNQIKDSYAHAKMALEAGRKLILNHVFYDYENLGIAKVVWDMTPAQCRMFLEETLTPEAAKELQNKEMLESIDVFFQYNLNISVAARELYVHRNTLVYRIEKFNKASGYNLSEFHDAALVQFILMVRRRLSDD